MKILLIYPRFLVDRIHEKEIAEPPIGVYYLAALLQEFGHDLDILNCQSIDPAPETIRGILSEKNPDLIGFSILNANRWGAIEIARMAKALRPEVRIVFGGPGATFLWEHLLNRFPEIDFVVLGEGEMPFLNLVNRLDGREAGPAEAIAGIAGRKDGKAFENPRPDPVPELDRLPDPAKYFTFRHVASSRGCAWNCTFCGSPRFWGRRVRFHSPEYFVNQLDRLARRGERFYYVSDDTFTMNKERVLAICREIVKRSLPISWNAISRVDCVDDKMLYWMRRAGCIQISYGIESADDGIRSVLNKKLRLEDVRRVFPLTQSYGILARAYFIYGAPGETAGTIQANIDLIEEIKPLSAIFYILDLFPGTELYERIKAHTGLTDDVWLNRIEGIMYGELDPTLSDEKILAFGQKLRTAYYENIHAYADQVELVDHQELYPLHADFLSRLGLTFSQGDYFKNELVREKEATAEKLFRRALGYAPDQRAYLGLGMLLQKAGSLDDSIQVLQDGLAHFPDNPDLIICLGTSLMNRRHYRQALDCFERFPESEQARSRAARCRLALNGPSPPSPGELP